MTTTKTTTKTVKVVCGRCDGKGEIPAYRGVLGGICFACKGAGHRMQKNAQRISPRWVVSAVRREDGQRIDVCEWKAPNEVRALARARTQLAGGTGYYPESAEVRLA